MRRMVLVLVTAAALSACGGETLTNPTSSKEAAAAAAVEVAPAVVPAPAPWWSGHIGNFGAWHVENKAGHNATFTAYYTSFDDQTKVLSDFSAPPHTGTSNNLVVNPGPVSRLLGLYPGMNAAGGTATGWTGAPTDQQAGAQFNMTVRACDQFFNRVTGNTHTIGLTSTDAFAQMPAQVTLVNGESVLPIRMYRSGYQRVTAVDETDGNVTGYTSTQIRIVGGPYSRIVVLCPGETIAPGTPEGRTGTATDQSINYSFVVTVQATDQWYNPVTGVTDVIHLASNDPLAQRLDLT